MKIVRWPNLWNAAVSKPVEGPTNALAFLQQMKQFVDVTKATRISEFQHFNTSSAPRLVACPTTGELAPPIRTFVLRDKTVFGLYNGHPRFWLAFCHLAQAYPPSALYMPEDDVLYKFDDPVWGVGQQHIEELQTIAGASLVTTNQSTLAPCGDYFVTGDQNFAHVLWNQLPALARFANEPHFQDTKVVVTHEPIAPLEDILPQLEASNVIRVPPSGLDNALNKYNGFINAPGATLLDSKTLELVKQACLRLASPFARSVRDSLYSNPGPIIWISIRDHQRTARNQGDFVKCIIERLFYNYNSINIVLDGFSLPADLETNPDYPQAARRETARNTYLAAEHIINGFHRCRGTNSSQKIFNACGVPVADSLHIASAATFYIAHHGTQQHKVGWLANCKGFVHANTNIIKCKPEFWAASMIDNGVRPVYIDIDLVEDVKEPAASDNEQVRSLHLGNYNIRDINRAADAALVILQSSL
jgi:hypothetical protein